MVEKSDVVEECSSCVRLQQEIEITRKDQAATLKMIKEKIMSTDKLIKKYQKKCDDFDKQAKQLNDLTAKHENCERNTEILQEQLSHSLEVTEPQKKTIKRLIQEKFVAEETIQEWKQKNVELEEVINQLKHGIQLRDEKDSSWKLEQQLQAKQIEKEKKRAEKLTKELEKAKEEIKKGKVLVKEQKRECRAFERKCTNFQFQVNKLKEELKYTRRNGGLSYQAKRKPSPRELNMTRSTRQSVKMCEEKLDELLSDSNQVCKSPAEDERPALTSIFDEMTNIADCPLSPVPPSPTESQDWSSESSDDQSDGSGTDSEGGSLGDLGDILELSLKNKNATNLEDETGEKSSLDGDAGGGLETESGDEDTEHNNESISAANDDENPENSEQIIQKENDKETMNDSYREKEHNTPEKRESEEQVRKPSVSEDIDTKCQSSLSGTSVISSDEVTSVATSKVPSQVSTRDSTAENMETTENTLQVVGSETTSIDKVSCESFDKESIEEVDIKNNNLPSTSLNTDVKDSLLLSDASENDDMKNCSESTMGIPNHFRTETPQMEGSGVVDVICGPVGGAVHKVAGEKLVSGNNVKSLDLDKSEAKEEFKDGGVAEFADHTSRVLPGKSIDEGNYTQDIPGTDNIQHAENDTSMFTPTDVNSTSTETIDDALESIQKEPDKNLSATETSVDETDAVSTRILEHDSIYSNDNDTLSKRDDKSNVADNFAKKYHLDSTEFSSKLLNEDENVALEESKVDSVDNKAVSQSSDLTKSYNKVDGDSSCYKVSSITVMEEGTDEVLEENDTLLSAESENTSKRTEYTSKPMENELKNEDKDDSLPSNNIKCGLENIDERLENILPENQEHRTECAMGNNVDEQVGLRDKNRDNVSDEEKSSSMRNSAHNLIVENSGYKILSLKQTSKNTKSREKSITDNAKISSLPNKDEVLELQKEVVRNNKRAKRSNPEESDVRRKRQKRVATPEVCATPTDVNSTSTETIDDTLESIHEEHDKNQSATETSVDEKDTVSTRILEHDSIYSNDDDTLSKRDDKSSVADNFAKKCHLDSTEFSSKLLNEDENVALEESKVDSVDNKAVSQSSDLTKSYNKVDGDSSCYKVSSITVLEEGTDEVLEEGETDEVVDTSATVLDVVHDTLEHHSSEGIMDIEAFTLVDAVELNSNDQNNPVDDTTINPSIDKSKASISDPSIPSLSLESVLSDSFHVFDVEMPKLSPLPPSPSSSGKSSPAHEEHIPSLFTSLPTLAALKTSFHSTSVGTSGVSLASFVSQTSITAKRHGPPAEYKDLEPLKKSRTPRQDTAEDSGHKQIKKLKVNKQMTKKLSVRPSFLTERQYADKVLVYLTQEYADIDNVVSRLSNTKTMSSDTPIANALVKFQHNEDLMPTIIQKYHDRDRQHQEQSSRLVHLNNWTPVLSVFEDRVSLMVTRISQVEHLKGLSTKVISLLSRAIIHSCSAAEEPDKRCIASHCRLVCALCRSESNLHRMRVLCYDIIRSLYSRPGTVLYLMISIAAVWPAVLVSSASVSATSKGFVFVCLAGESYLPLTCTIQMILTTWARTYDWVLLGNVLDWLCAWKQVPSGVLSLEQLAGELVRIMKDPSSAKLMRGKDGHPVLGFGLYEVIKALELVSCMLGWAWLHNVLVRGYLWDILTGWINQIQSETKCSDVMTPCLDHDGNCHNDSKSLSTSVNHNNEDRQRTNRGTGDTSSGIDVVKNDGSESLSTSVNQNNEDRQRTNHGTGDTSSGIDVVKNDGSESLSTSVNQNKEDRQRTNHGTGDTNSGIDVVKNDGSDSLSTSANQNKEDRQRTDAGDTRNSNDVLRNDPQGDPPDQVPEPTVVAAIRLLGLVCRIAVQHYQKIPRVIPLLVGLLQTTRDCPVPYAVQLASAYSLLEMSPWQPSRVLSALDEWKAVQDSQNKSLPASLIQGIISLRICLALRKEASVLSEGYTKMLHDKDM